MVVLMVANPIPRILNTPQIGPSYVEVPYWSMVSKGRLVVLGGWDDFNQAK